MRGKAAELQGCGSTEGDRLCVAIIVIPPPARCAATAASSRASLVVIERGVGSSSSHSGAGAANSRASASRRRCPADSQRHGQSAIASSAKSGKRLIEHRCRGRQVTPAQGRPEGKHLPRRQRRLSSRRDGRHSVTARMMGREIARQPACRPMTIFRRWGPAASASEPQQARLAAAIGAGQHQRAAGRQPERDAGKDQPLAAAASEILTGEMGSGGAAAGSAARRRRAVRLDNKKRRPRRGNPEPLGRRPLLPAEYEVWGTNL